MFKVEWILRRGVKETAKGLKGDELSKVCEKKGKSKEGGKFSTPTLKLLVNGS
jgi:hypothetical protein